MKNTLFHEKFGFSANEAQRPRIMHKVKKMTEEDGNRGGGEKKPIF